MTTFVLCSTDEATFEDLIGMIVVVGTAERFVTDQDLYNELPEYVLEDITVIQVIE